MRLSDIMSQMGLTSYAEAALILFFLVFTVIAVRVFFFSSSDEIERAKQLPLNDHSAPNARENSTGEPR